MPDDFAKQHVARSGKRQRACLGDCGASAAHVGLVEFERRAQLDDRGCCVPDRCEAVPDLVVCVARVDAPRVGENGLEHGPDLVGAPLEEVRVKAFEARLGPAIRLAFRLRAGERG